jgi:hypothetical protein
VIDIWKVLEILERWSPKIVARMNGYDVKLVKFRAVHLQAQGHR